ncbi:dihydrofolate reductase family protein [Glutamicibacter sp. MNS18]|uniref:dihydrofolate reductase family protein n=1 Tax=Glutamicibacter sp. MNS18 TaxID=2989817 RepID=UPI0022354F75|nr:dihydrofolate reductase family protein [Glutamicibacter sp. MNS18]MCW4464380.1 dihydrofolate reductase family protein [Glutamicibacter sp. MNS18]
MRSLFPRHQHGLDDQDILERYAATPHPFVRFNFVSSLDGSAQVNGLSAGLGSPADARVFALLRRLASVILVGAGTVRAEGYDGGLLDEQSQHWRVARGMDAHPVLAIISRGLNIEPDAPVLTRSPAPVLLFTAAEVNQHTSSRYPRNVELIQLEDHGHWCNAAQIVRELQDRGLGLIHAEGGPHILGQFIAQDMVDSLCVSLSPLLVAGPGSRISRTVEEVSVRLELHSVLEEDGMLLTEYRRHADPSGSTPPDAPSV